jgi:hypothetical protein
MNLLLQQSYHTTVAKPRVFSRNFNNIVPEEP